MSVHSLKSATAAELCRMIDSSVPVSPALARLRFWVTTRLKDDPNARSIPVLTMRTANNNNIVAPINSTMNEMMIMVRRLLLQWRQFLRQR